MSERVYIKDVAGKIGTEVKLQGFADNIRNSKSMLFIVLKDITGKVQITWRRKRRPSWRKSWKQ